MTSQPSRSPGGDTSRTISPLAPPKPASGLGRLPAGRWFLLVGAIVTLLFAGSIAFTLQTMTETREARATLVEVIDPLVLHTLELSTSVSNEEATMRGYGRTNESFYLDDFASAQRDSATARGKIEALLPRVPVLRATATPCSPRSRTGARSTPTRSSGGCRSSARTPPPRWPR